MRRKLLIFVTVFSFSFAMGQQQYHTIQSGETLESIAKKYKVSVDDLVQANPEALSKMYEGMQLTIPQSGKSKRKVDRENKSGIGYQPVQEFSYDNSSTVQDNATVEMTNENSDGQDFRKNTWHFAFRLGPSFFKGEKSSSGSGRNKSFSSSSSTGYEMALGAHYYFLENLYGSAMLGYYATYFTSVGTYYGTTTSVSSESKNIQLPIEIGFVLPISKLIGLVLEAGPSFLYAVDGYVKTNGEKKSFSEIEKDSKIDRFSVLLKLGGGLKFGGFRVQGFYGIPLTKVQGGEKKGFWGITLGAEF